MNTMSQQKMLSRHSSRQSSIACDTASVASIKSFKSEHSHSSSNGHNKSTKFKTNGLGSRQGSQESSSGTSSSISSSNETNNHSANILNVAEMLLHGVADNEIFDIWLKSINCQEFLANFIDAGYDMPTLSRITPQDLTAIGVTDPSKRAMILAEIKKLNIQDGIPKFRPANLSHLLSLVRLDNYYLKLLCDQDIDTIDKLCQLTWEDFEELGITRLGHQKRIQLVIERLKELESDDKQAIKPMSEPIYDTNPSQILLVASAENHCMNGPIMHKQSSTSELSSTGSGSMQSVYSAASNHYQSTYSSLNCGDPQNNLIANQTSLPDMSKTQPSQQPPSILQQAQPQKQQQQQQAIYSQPMPSLIYQQPSQLMGFDAILPQTLPQVQTQQSNQPVVNFHISQQNRINQSMPIQGIGGPNMDNNIFPPGPNLIQNRQSLSQIPPIGRLANLPLHQQQLLQQSSIYATLTRQPMNKMKRTPPPVPIRTDSLKNNSNAFDGINRQQSQQPQPINFNQTISTHGFRPPQFDHIHRGPSSSITKPAINSQNGNQSSSQSVLSTSNGVSFNATTGKDDNFPPPPSPLPCVGESCRITT